MLVAGSLNCVEWSLLPPATEEMVAQAEQLKGRFQGDPSFEYEHIEINAADAERLFEDGKEVNTTKHFQTLFATVVPLTLDRWWLLLRVCNKQPEPALRSLSLCSNSFLIELLLQLLLELDTAQKYSSSFMFCYAQLGQILTAVSEALHRNCRYHSL